MTPPWIRLQQCAEEFRGLIADTSQGEIHPQVSINGVVSLGKGSVIKAGTVIEGRVRIGRNCTIGPHAYLRGNVSIGDGCLIGNAVEIKNSILGNGVAVAHLTYIGDSVLEDDINVGGGCIFSNFRHDGGEIRMPWEGSLMPTGLSKLGCYIGSHARIGARCVILPGRALPEGTWTMPGEVVSMCHAI